MDLYDLGPINWWETQCYYHALAYLGREGLIICCPTSPYVCLGLHDDYDQEIDHEFCTQTGIPVFRRETGGGVVYLDQRQVFFQLVLKRDNPRLPLHRQRYYQHFLQPAVSVCKDYGLPAQVKEPADIVAAGKKCSGNACGDIGRGVAYVGNILLDFDYRTMSRVMRVPHQSFREHFRLAMQANMTTLKDWIEEPVDYDQVAARLVDRYSQQWGDLQPLPADQELIDKAREIFNRVNSEEWLRMPGRRYSQRRIKVAEGVMLLEQRLGPELMAAVLVRGGRVEELKMVGSPPSHSEFFPEIVGQPWREDLLAAFQAV
ncbi:MAG: lipoate--protein ligase family protein [Syntrophomonadaceae bacterium]